MNCKRDNWLMKLSTPAGWAYLTLIRATGSYKVEGEANIAPPARPVLCPVWHNRLLGPIIRHRNENVGVLISRSKDGEYISRIAKKFGYAPLRGSSSRGGGHALRSTFKHLDEGFDVVFTPDGPRGPRYTVSQGIAYVAVKTGRPVVPLGVGMSRKKVFASWDRFQLPLPFCKISLVYGEPILFRPECPEKEAAETIRAALVRATDRADLILGTTSP